MLTDEARVWFSDIGRRRGTIVAIDGWPIIEWDGLLERNRIKPIHLMVAT